MHRGSSIRLSASDERDHTGLDPRTPLYLPSSFILFINDLLDTFSQVSCTTFADDAKLYSDDPAKLQQLLTQVEELCHKWQLSISVEKCSILRFVRGLCMQFVV